ncbi:MAG TPA: nucleotidyltransferase domain-containing protein [Burkholderiales bacterium]|nr:nucleotidyltransferase domain-containing protein [Burkholderiales bacterium]
MDRAARSWAVEQSIKHPQMLRVGYFGSYARGDWGVGSDLDLVVVVAEDDQPFIQRGSRWDASTLPVPTDVLVYTKAEWDQLQAEGGRFARMLREETVWLFERESCHSAA